MTVGEVFAKAWELWKRDVGWLILAGLVVGLIVGVVAVVVFAIVAGMAAVSIGGIAIGSNGNSTSLTGLERRHAHRRVHRRLHRLPDHLRARPWCSTEASSRW